MPEPPRPNAYKSAGVDIDAQESGLARVKKLARVHLHARRPLRDRQLRRPLPARPRRDDRAGARGLGRRRRHQARRGADRRRLLDRRARPGQPLRQRHPGAGSRCRSSSSTTSAPARSSRRSWSELVRGRRRGLPRRTAAPSWAARPPRCPASTSRATTSWWASSSAWSTGPRLLDGSRVAPGDVLVGLPSARASTPTATRSRAGSSSRTPGLGLRDRAPWAEERRTVGEELLAPHLSYLEAAPPAPRPPGPARPRPRHRRRADRQPAARPARRHPRRDPGRELAGAGALPLPAGAGEVESEEMFRVFNMGIGMVACRRARRAGRGPAAACARRGSGPSRSAPSRRGAPASSTSKGPGRSKGSPPAAPEWPPASASSSPAAAATSWRSRRRSSAARCRPRSPWWSSNRRGGAGAGAGARAGPAGRGHPAPGERRTGGPRGEGSWRRWPRPGPSGSASPATCGSSPRRSWRLAAAGSSTSTRACCPPSPACDAQAQALAHGVKVSGCTVHLVDEGSTAARSSSSGRCRCWTATRPRASRRASSSRSTAPIRRPCGGCSRALAGGGAAAGLRPQLPLSRRGSVGPHGGGRRADRVDTAGPPSLHSALLASVGASCSSVDGSPRELTRPPGRCRVSSSRRPGNGADPAGAAPAFRAPVSDNASGAGQPPHGGGRGSPVL